MRKLLQINSTLNSASTGRIAEKIGKCAIEQGWDSYIAYGRSFNRSSSIPIRIGSKSDVYCHGVYSLLTDRHGLASESATRSFLKQVYDIRPDLIHLHNIHGYYLNYKLLFEYLERVDIPVVWTLHDCWPITGHCAHFESADCNKWETECGCCPLRASYPRSLLIDNSRRNFQLKKRLFSLPENMVIVTVSNWLKGIVEESFLKEYPIRTIYNGIDTSVFRPLQAAQIKQKLECEKKNILLGVATAWGERKGLFDYYKLAEILPKEIQIVLIGLSKKQIARLPDNIIGIERTESQQELAEYYSAADIVLNLSYAETFGLTTVEGFACGTPGIVYDRTASPELISEDTGIMVEAGDVVQVYQAIQKILKRGKQAYSTTCRNRALTFFDGKQNYAEYIHLYNELLGR